VVLAAQAFFVSLHETVRVDARDVLGDGTRGQTEFEIMTNLLTLLRSSIAAFFDWWLRELAGLVPRRFRQRGRRERRGTVLLFGPQKSVVLERTVDGERALGSVDTHAPDHDRGLGDLLKQAKRRARPVTVRLSDELGLRKTLDLPLAAKDDLDQMLRFEMDRLTPFRADEVYFAHRVLGSDARNRRLSLELHLAPRREVDRVLTAARSFGLVPARLELAGGTEDGDRLNLLPSESGHGTREGRLNCALALFALMLAVSAVAIPLQRQRATLDELDAKAAAARAQAEESLAIRDRLDELTRSTHLLVADKTRQPLVVQVLEELTRLVPDQAYLIQLELHDQTVELHGFAATASDLIRPLEESLLFKAPQFRSPVTRDRRGGAERFHISVELISAGSP
jgi:general secretion pathway protein L